MSRKSEINEKNVSTVCMCLTSSNGTWLNGCLQPQHYFVSMDIHDPDHKLVARVSLSYEQAAKMMLYNGDVECTLTQYRDTSGKLVSEEVEPPKTVHQRMKERLSETQESLLKRVEDVRRDLYEMVNGDAKRNKGKIEELLESVKVIQSHLKANESFVVQQAEEELCEMQSNAAGQLGLFLQSKFGIEAPEDAIKQLIPVSKEPLLLGEPIEPVQDNYQLKHREQKPIDDMTAMQVADLLQKRLSQIEKAQPDRGSEKCHLFGARASAQRGEKVNLTYISYQGTSIIELEDAKKYLKFLLSIKSVSEFKSHWHYNKG